MTGRQNIAAIACVVTSLVTAGCGTLCTRFTPIVGGAPFAAVAWDVVALTKVAGPTHRLLDIDWSGTGICTIGLVSLPVDLAVDVVALPFDLVAWAFGSEKLVLHPYVRDRRDGSAEKLAVSGR